MHFYVLNNLKYTLLLKYHIIIKLTVASFLGIFVPRGSFLTIILKGDMLAQNCSQGLPLKFQAGTFGAIKIFRKKNFTGSSSGCIPET